MKKIIIIILAIPLILSCNKVLDTKPYDKITGDIIWNNRKNAESFIFATYDQIMKDYTGGGMATDPRTINEICASGNGIYKKAYPVFTETINRNTDLGFNNWADIRRCNLIISEVNASTMPESDKKDLVAEAKFLRAMSYFSVARSIGRIVWIDTVLTPKDNLLLPSTKSPEESYNYIIKDLKDAVEGLPATSESGRANKYVAAAMLTEVGLEAIAYENYPNPPSLNSSLIDMVIKYANMVIQDGGYSLESDYGAMFNEVKPSSNEIILALYKDKINTVMQNTPMQFMVTNVSDNNIKKNNGSPLLKSTNTPFQAWWRYGPTYNLAEDYLVIDKNDPSKALPWDQTSQYKDAVDESQAIPVSKIPHASGETSIKHGVIRPGSAETVWTLTNEGRDARWNASIISDSTSFYGETFTTCLHGNTDRWMRINGFGNFISLTNMYWRKGIYNNLPKLLWSVPTNYHYVITRLGRVYLNLAEAYLLKGDIPDAVASLNMTRTVHGQLPPSTASSLTDAWTDYKRERRVDLTLENDYYWSLLRWGRYGGAANYGNAPGNSIPELTEVPLVMDRSKDRKAFSVVEGPFFGVDNIRAFDYSRRYLFPIAQNYLDRNPNFGPQNAGW